MNIRRKSVIYMTCIGLLVSCFSFQPVAPVRPNIVYILADDMGYGDIAVYNPEGKIVTPHLDRLAAQGMRFTDAHSPSSVCTPTRYSLMTGRYPWRSRLPVGVLRGYSSTLIEEDRATVAKLLKDNGYATGVVGKWHLGLDWKVKEGSPTPKASDGLQTEMDPEGIDFIRRPGGGPLAAGFDYSFILPASLDMPPYCYLENHQLTELPTAYTEGNALESGYTGPFWRAGKKGPTFDFHNVLPTFVERATGFIRRQSAGKPFFLYVPLAAPHTPWVPTDNYKGKSKVGEYGDFVQQTDAAVGEIVRTLQESGFANNTMIIFASDNGPFWREKFVQLFNHKAVGDFKGMKGDAFEGGHRIPFIVRWPGKVKPGTVSQASTTLANLLATCADIVGNKDSRFVTEDSYSILPVLLGKSGQVPGQPAIVHSASSGLAAIRKGDWKLIQGLGSGGFTEPREVKPTPGMPDGQLYNLKEDKGETRNLYAQYPDKVRELSELLEQIKQSKKKIVTK